MRTKWLGIVLFLASGTRLWIGADTVRGQVIESTRIGNGSSESRIVTLRLEDLWEIQLDEEIDLVRGIEIFIESPPEAQIYRGTYALYLYSQVSPAPSSSLQSYTATLYYFKPFLQERKMYIHIPLETIAGFTRGPDTFIPENPIGKAHFPLLFTFLPIMKGIPDSALNAQFKVQVRPLFKNLGKVFFLLKTPSGIVPIENAQIFLDDKPISLEGQESINLEPGLKGFRIEVSGYPPFQTTVAVERGKVVTIEAIFMKREAKIRMNAPLGTRIFIDGKPAPLGSEEMILEPGEHTFSFRLGDYQVSKKFYLEQGKSYGVSLYLDILMNED
jgi:hypothetical protein